MLYSVSLSSKNQVTIPSVLSRALNLKRGERLVVEQVDHSLVFTKAEDVVHRLSGFVHESSPVSDSRLENMIDRAKEQNGT